MYFSCGIVYFVLIYRAAYSVNTVLIGQETVIDYTNDSNVR